jgi:hypothetical protein
MEWNLALMSSRQFQNYYGINLNTNDGRWEAALAMSQRPTASEFSSYIAPALGAKGIVFDNETWLTVTIKPAVYAGGLEAENQIAMGLTVAINISLGILKKDYLGALSMRNSSLTQGGGPASNGYEKFGVYDAIGFGADMSELYRQGYGAVQFGMRLGKAEHLLKDARIIKTMSASRQAFNTSVSAFKTAGKGIAVIGGIATAAEFLASDRSGGDYAKLAGGIIIIGTAFIPVVGPFISVGLGLLDGAGAFDGLYRLAD